MLIEEQADYIVRLSGYTILHTESKNEADATATAIRNILSGLGTLKKTLDPLRYKHTMRELERAAKSEAKT